MLHHIDVHVRDVAATAALLDAIGEFVGYHRLESPGDDDEPGFVGFGTAEGGRPRIGLIPDESARGGTMRLAFSARSREEVDGAARAARDAGALAIEGPALHEEYGDYYAVFFEDRDGNRFEIAAV